MLGRPIHKVIRQRSRQLAETQLGRLSPRLEASPLNQRLACMKAKQVNQLNLLTLLIILYSRVHTWDALLSPVLPPIVTCKHALLPGTAALLQDVRCR